MDFVTKQIVRGKKEGLDIEYYSPEELENLKELSEKRLISLQNYCTSKQNVWDNLNKRIKDFLFYNKSNLQDVCSIVLYAVGFKSNESIVMCEKLTSQHSRRELEGLLRDLSLEDILVQQVRLNLNISGQLQY